jgi:hypothetical protein
VGLLRKYIITKLFNINEIKNELMLFNINTQDLFAKFEEEVKCRCNWYA